MSNVIIINNIQQLSNTIDLDYKHNIKFNKVKINDTNLTIGFDTPKFTRVR